MQTRVIRVDAANPDAAALAEAAAILRQGGLVAFPTETVYGLGANALDAGAVARIFTAKGRPSNNPIIVHVATVEQARDLTNDWPDVAARLAECFWPGPLTLVLPRGTRVPDIVTASGPTVAVRVPAHSVALALLHATALPLAAPSANPSSHLSPTHPDHVLHGLEGKFDLLLDAGPTTGGVESTVLDLTASLPRLLRPGLISPARIEAVIGPIQRATPLAVSRSLPLPSPGLLPRHYAPRAILECEEKDAATRVEALCRQGVQVGWLVFGVPASACLSGSIAISMPADPPSYAGQLYAALHRLDDAGVERIVVSMPPDTEEWLAVRDRLLRASRASE
jgi:L-threonylcarbamoyladenylate synthase